MFQNFGLGAIHARDNFHGNMAIAEFGVFSVKRFCAELVVGGFNLNRDEPAISASQNKGAELIFRFFRWSPIGIEHIVHYLMSVKGIPRWRLTRALLVLTG